MANVHLVLGRKKASWIRAAAVILLASFFLSFSACGKKSSVKETDVNQIDPEYLSGKEIRETDPYYDAKISALNIPVDEEQTFVSKFIHNCKFIDGIAIARYEVWYEETEMSSDPDEDMIDQGCYVVAKTALFDENGDQICEFPSECQNVCDFAVDNDGNICVLGYFQNIDNDEEVLRIEVFSPEGKKIKTVYLGGKKYFLEDPSEIYLSILSDGRYCISYEKIIVLYQEDGNPNFGIRDGDRTLSSTIVSSSGKNYVVSSYAEGSDTPDIKIKELNLETGEFVEEIDASYLAAFDYVITTTEGIFVQMEAGLFQVDILTGEVSKVFDWNDTDVGRDIAAYTVFSFKDPKDIYAVHQDFSVGAEGWRLIHMTRAEKNPYAGKKELLVGGIGMSISNDFLSFVAEYNRDPDSKCRVILHDYFDDMGMGESYAGLQMRVYREILSGKGPDILVNFALFPMYRSDDVMEDMNTYLDGPDGTDRSQYFDNILRAYETDGHLYHMPVNYGFSGIEINTKYISNTGGWTFDEFEEAAAKIPDDVDFFESMKREDFLNFLMYESLLQFVDYKDKKADFQNDTMRKYLELAETFGKKRLPTDEGYEEIDLGNGNYAYGEDYTEDKFYKGKLAGRKFEIGSASDIALQRDKMRGKEGYLGFPSFSGAGMMVDSTLSLGITATSENKEEAWDLIRSYLEHIPESEKQNRCFSVNKEAFEKGMQKEIEEMRALYAYMIAMGFEPEDLKDDYIIPAENDIDVVRDLIENATTTYMFDINVYTIIEEESTAYFKGEKTEDEVLEAIQKRVEGLMKDL